MEYMKSKPYRIAVCCASGVEAITKREMIALGLPEAPAENGRLCFNGDADDIALCNLMLRTADRVLIELGKISASTFDELFDGIIALPLYEIIPKDAKLLLTGNTVKSKLHAISAAKSVAHKAIAQGLMQHYHLPHLPETGAEYRLELNIVQDVATLSLNTSGAGLHKRGYRDLVGAAPLKETLAAAIILLSVWKKDRILVDPFCGSGTLAIEAARIAKNIPSGNNRDFDFLHHGLISEEHWLSMKEKANAGITDAPLHIMGFDIDPSAISLALHHAERAGVKGCIHFQRQDMRQFSSKHRHGIFITNPPYAVRIGEKQQVEALYKDFGNLFRSLPDWSAYVLCGYPGFESCFGGKPTKKRKLYNAALECYLYQYLGKPPERKRTETNEEP
ncbi:MAG: class I SAM-dependent RNA methyltransferase [Clostridia bacterium]|nr:class I SAM-dependent RNA methyltransferase [Clostridia bacterium]